MSPQRPGPDAVHPGLPPLLPLLLLPPVLDVPGAPVGSEHEATLTNPVVEQSIA